MGGAAAHAGAVPGPRTFEPVGPGASADLASMAATPLSPPPPEDRP